MHKTCMIIPCYNEARRLPFKALSRFLEKHASISLCFVDDGSRDRTSKSVKAFQKRIPERIFLTSHTKNKGKAEAVRTGINTILKQGAFETLAYFDADFATPPEEIFLLLDAIQNNPGCMMATGARVLRAGSDIKRKRYRHILGRTFSVIAGIMLRLPVYDTQCGAKIFTKDLAEKIFHKPFISPWFFDVEIFKRLTYLHGKNRVSTVWMEVPLRKWRHIEGSNLKIADFIKAPFELIKISLWYQLYYKG